MFAKLMRTEAGRHLREVSRQLPGLKHSCRHKRGVYEHKTSPNQKVGFDPTERISYYLSFYSTWECDKALGEYALKTGPGEFIALSSDPAKSYTHTQLEAPEVVPLALMRLLGT